MAGRREEKRREEKRTAMTVIIGTTGTFGLRGMSGAPV
jgi:hypothetical protein